jgi:Replication-relaxation
VSGRRKPPGGRPGPDQLAGRLSDRDLLVCRLLLEHLVLTTDLLALLLAVAPRTLQQRLTELTRLQVLDRFRPHPPVGAGSAPYHYLLGEAGAALLAADQGSTVVDGVGSCHEQVLALAQANGQLTHLLGVNRLLAVLTYAAHTRTGSRLVCWWPTRRCQARWGPLIAPDAYARWHALDGEVDFFLHHDPAQQPPEQLAGLVGGYNDLAVATQITTPVLLWLAGPDREARMRRQLAGQRLLIPIATSNPSRGHPADPVWLPTSSPDSGPRYRLGALGRAHPWQPQPTQPDRDRHASPAGTVRGRLKTLPGRGRTPPPHHPPPTLQCQPDQQQGA